MAARGRAQKTPEEFVSEIKTMLSSNVSRSIQLMTRANDLIRKTVENASSQGRPSLTEPETLERWLNFNVAAYSVISDHTLSLLDKLISVAEGAVVGGATAATAAERPGDIKVSGRRGERCSAVFVVQHQYEQPLDVAFEATPLVAEGAAPLPSSHVSFDPSFTAIEPGNPAMVTVQVDIGEGFVAGKTYVTNIHVLGYESKPLVLSIDVLPPPGAEPGTRTARPTARPVKKRGAASSGKGRTSRGAKPAAKGAARPRSKKERRS